MGVDGSVTLEIEQSSIGDLNQGLMDDVGIGPGNVVMKRSLTRRR